MVKIRCAIGVSAQVSSIGVEVRTAPRRYVCNYMTGHILQGFRITPIIMMKASHTIGVISVSGRWGPSSIATHDPVFRVIDVAVYPIIQQVTRRVEGEAVHPVLVAAEADAKRVRAVLVPAIPEPIVVIRVSLPSRGSTCQTIEGVVAVGPISIDASG